MNTKNVKRKIWFCSIAFAIVFIGGLIYFSHGPYTVNQVMADRILLAESPDQLEEVSDLIVLAEPQDGKNVLIRDSDDNNIILGYTKTTAVVLQVLKGDISEGQKINITEECYTTNLNSVLWTQEGYLPMEKGGNYLLYLKAYPQDSEYQGMYFPVDLEYGKYLIPQTAVVSDSLESYTAEQLQVGEETDITKYTEWYQEIAGSYLSDKTYK